MKGPIRRYELHCRMQRYSDAAILVCQGRDVPFSAYAMTGFGAEVRDRGRASNSEEFSTLTA